MHITFQTDELMRRCLDGSPQGLTLAEAEDLQAILADLDAAQTMTDLPGDPEARGADPDAPAFTGQSGLRVATRTDHVAYPDDVAPSSGERSRVKVVRLERRDDDGQYRVV